MDPVEIEEVGFFLLKIVIIGEDIDLNLTIFTAFIAFKTSMCNANTTIDNSTEEDSFYFFY